MSAHSHSDAIQAARRQRLAEAQAAEWVDDDVQVRWTLARRLPCPRYFWRSRSEDGITRLELADAPEHAEWAMAQNIEDCPARWPASDLLDLDTGAELSVSVNSQNRVVIR